VPEIPDQLKDQERDDESRSFGELRSSGLLWLINRVVFHPRGFALALTMHDGEPTGWTLLGDGSEVWRFDGDEDDLFERASKTLNDHVAAYRAGREDAALEIYGDTIRSDQLIKIGGEWMSYIGARKVAKLVIAMADEIEEEIAARGDQPRTLLPGEVQDDREAQR
jgi:hypothetical protein